MKNLNGYLLQAFVRLTTALRRRMEGATMLEYAVIAAVVVVVGAAAFKLLGTGLAKFINDKILPLFS